MDALLALALAALPVLFLLACPVGMFLLMRTGMGHGSMAAPTSASDRRELRAPERLAELERQHAALAEEIAHARRELAGQMEPPPVETRAQ